MVGFIEPRGERGGQEPSTSNSPPTSTSCLRERQPLLPRPPPAPSPPAAATPQGVMVCRPQHHQLDRDWPECLALPTRSWLRGLRRSL